MTCLPTTREGYVAALAWFVFATRVEVIVPYVDRTATPSPRTTQEAIDAVVARVRAR